MSAQWEEQPIEFKVGQILKLDDWGFHTPLMQGDDFVDSGYHGCQFRIQTNHIHAPASVAVNLTQTGKRIWQRNYGDRVRVKVEFVGDCEPSTFGGGYVCL